MCSWFDVNAYAKDFVSHWLLFYSLVDVMGLSSYIILKKSSWKEDSRVGDYKTWHSGNCTPDKENSFFSKLEDNSS